MTDCPPAWIEEAMSRADEPLVPELAECLVEGGPLGQSLKHPLVYQVPFFPAMAYHANDQLAAKQKAIVDAVDARNWHTAVWLHERPYRASALEQVSGSMPDSEYWDLTGDVYVDTENFWQESRRWAKLLTASRKRRECFMTEEERAALAEMPDELTIYRGINGRGKRLSWAWTLDRDRGEWFAHRLYTDRRAGGRKPTLLTATAAKADVIGYLERRGEEEIVIQPSKVLITKSEAVNAK